MRADLSPPHRIILLHPLAPAKPELGASCNGCGVCCTAQPCPLGMWISRRRQGRCKALVWDDGPHRYHCGALAAPEVWLGRLAWLPARWTQALVRRWIAAGRGCDSDLLIG